MSGIFWIGLLAGVLLGAFSAAVALLIAVIAINEEDNE